MKCVIYFVDLVAFAKIRFTCYRFREMPTTLKIINDSSYVAKTLWPANVCAVVALAATNVFDILTLLRMKVQTQFTNPS